MSISIKNRNRSYADIVDKLPTKRQLIFKLIKKSQPCTSQELVAKYLLPINEVVGRITDLKNECLVVESGTKLNKYTNKDNTTYRVVMSLEERIRLINNKYKNLIDEKAKLEEDYHLGVSRYTKEMILHKIKVLNKRINKLGNLV